MTPLSEHSGTGIFASLVVKMSSLFIGTYLACTAIVLLGSTATGIALAAVSNSVAPGTVTERIGLQRPGIPFIANRGQLNQQLRYYTYTDTGIVYVSDSGEIIYALTSNNRHAQGTRTQVLRERIVNARDTRVEGRKLATSRINIFSGNRPQQWKRDIPTYESVSLGPVYPGIEVLLHAHDNSVEKLFLVEPGANPDSIHVALEGGEPTVNRDGELVIKSLPGTVRFSKPIAFQELDDGSRAFIDVDYRLTPGGYRFVTGKYDRSRSLIIDPVLAASYLGGSDRDNGFALALNSQGHVYVAGLAESADLPGIIPGTSADSTFAGSTEAFIARLDADLGTLLSATFIGGSGPFTDIGRALAIDGSDHVYLAGTTNSPDFPGVNAGSADPTFVGNSEGFVIKLSADLTTIQASTFLGGSSDEDALALVVDASGDVVVAGSTNSSVDFPGVGIGSADPTVALTEGIVAKLDSNLSSIINATYLGGSGANERVEAVTVDGAGNIYVAGVTGSNDFPGINAASADSTFGPLFDLEAFVAKLDSGLGTLLAASYAGGDDSDSAAAIALANGDVYIGGRTSSANFPGIVATAADPTLVGSEDAFIARFNTTLTAIGAASYLGGSGNGDVILAIEADSSGNLYVAGESTSKDFPGVSATSADSDPGAAAAEAFITRLNADLETILASTYLGGSGGNEFAFGLALDVFGNVYVAGLTGSDDFPGIDAGSADSVFSVEEAFVAKLDPALSDSPPDCSNAAPRVDSLWPPNHKMVAVALSGVTDPEGTPVAITIDSVAQDENVTGKGSGATCPDAGGIGSDTVLLRAERSGKADGRVYHVSFTASDGGGKQCSGIVTVCVPHSKNKDCTDGGPVYDSTVCP